MGFLRGGGSLRARAGGTQGSLGEDYLEAKGSTCNTKITWPTLLKGLRSGL